MLLAFAKSRRGGEKPHRPFNPITRLAKKAHKEATIIVIGGGAAGSATALHLPRLGGVQPPIIEGESFPRFHTGESLSGECCAGLRTLDMEPEIRRQKHPIKHGVKVFSPHRRAVFVEVKKRCTKTNALIPTSSR